MGVDWFEPQYLLRGGVMIAFLVGTMMAGGKLANHLERKDRERRRDALSRAEPDKELKYDLFTCDDVSPDDDDE